MYIIYINSTSNYSVPVCCGSYLHLPRITFAGQFQVDVSTVNNELKNYNVFDGTVKTEQTWNEYGTGEVSFSDCIITSVTYQNGTISYKDPLVKKPIIVNPQSSRPKLIDIDPESQNKSQIYGMKFGIFQDIDNLAFLGDWQPSIIAQDTWTRVSCLSESDNGTSSYWIASKGTTRITSVTWGDTSFSEALNQLHNNGLTKDLSVGQNYFYSTTGSATEYLQNNFTLGYVVGTIGIAEIDEPLNFAGERLMTFEGVKQSDIAFPSGVECNNPDAIRMYKAPFVVVNDSEHNTRLTVTVDFGNSLSMDRLASIRNLSVLYLGILTSDGCVKIIANIPYLEEGWLRRTAGVVDFHLDVTDMNTLANSELAVVRGTDSSDLTVCSNTFKYGFRHVQILLKETAYFVRPLEDYVFRLTKGQSQPVKLYVTHFGKPSNNTPITLQRANPWSVPEDGIIVESMTAVTDSEGVAEFNFTGGYVPYPRNSSAFDELLDIDGQVYRFVYYVTSVNDSCYYGVYQKTNSILLYNNSEMAFATCTNEITFLVWSDVTIKQHNYTWVEDIEPIFRQYYILYPVMRNILNLSDYCDVVQTHNIQLLNYSMRLDFNHPSYMPVTRDLSPVKRDMILEWLMGNPPRFSNNTEFADPICPEMARGSILNREENFHQDNDVLEEQVYPFNDETLFSAKTIGDTELTDSDCTDINKVTTADLPERIYYKMDRSRMDGSETLCPVHDYYNCIATIPKHTESRTQWLLDAKFSNCSLHTLRQQLQQAVQLEFYTIPLYLTSLWTIKEGCNDQVRELIRSIVMQEMLHMIQVANILIAVGGRPIIDSNECAPKYPAKGLPGNVLPQIEVTL